MLDAQHLLGELEPEVERLLERHLSNSKEWFPHELVPYGRGRDYTVGEIWNEAGAELGGAAFNDEIRSALVVNLLTEDNLPYYFRSVERMFGKEGPWGTWVRRWTAEEGRHSMVIYGYLTVTRAVDPVALERARMAQVEGGNTPDPKTLQHGFVYLSLQELATRISHRATGKLIADPIGEEIMTRVAADENLHQVFYRDLASAALDVDPNGMLIAMEDQVTNFAMPGVGIPNFSEHAKRIANAGIYDLAVHNDQILEPVLTKFWNIEEIEGLDADGEQARERLVTYLAKSKRVANRLRERREAAADRQLTTAR